MILNPGKCHYMFLVSQVQIDYISLNDIVVETKTL